MTRGQPQAGRGEGVAWLGMRPPRRIARPRPRGRVRAADSLREAGVVAAAHARLEGSGCSDEREGGGRVVTREGRGRGAEMRGLREARREGRADRALLPLSGDVHILAMALHRR